MKLELHYFEGCPGHPPLRDMARDVLAAFGIQGGLEEINVDSPERAQSLAFKGSPTLLIDGRDLEDRTDAIHGLGCRVYDGKPVPEKWLVEAAVLRALKPRKILFMCVQNSARSQLAEAIARCLAPPGVGVLSAGSTPAFVRPQALQVLQEAGISTEGLYSKAVDSLDPAGVEAVVTLCAEEVCPVFLGKAHRLHWGLPDPAKAEPEAAKLDAFRAVRDELTKRFKVMLGYSL